MKPTEPDYEAQAAWMAIGAAEQRYQARRDHAQVIAAQLALEGYTVHTFKAWAQDIRHIRQACGGDPELGVLVVEILASVYPHTEFIARDMDEVRRGWYLYS